MPVFQDSKEPVFYVPEGDCQFCVIGFEQKYSQGAKTAGSEQYEFKCEVEGKGSYFFDTLTVHDSCIWRLEAFLRAAGIKLAKGQAWSFVQSEAEQTGATYINPFGLRGHVHLIVDQYPPGTGAKKNKVGSYYAPSVKYPELAPRVIEPAPDDDIPF